MTIDWKIDARERKCTNEGSNMDRIPDFIRITVAPYGIFDLHDVPIQYQIYRLLHASREDKYYLILFNREEYVLYAGKSPKLKYKDAVEENEVPAEAVGHGTGVTLESIVYVEDEKNRYINSILKKSDKYYLIKGEKESELERLY